MRVSHGRVSGGLPSTIQQPIILIHDVFTLVTSAKILLRPSSSSSSIYLDKTKHKCQGHVGTYRHRGTIHERVVIAVQ